MRRHRRTRAWTAALIVIALCGFSGPMGFRDATAQDVPDYDVSDTSWRGLSQFAELMLRQGGDVRHADAVDYGALTPEDVLIIVYPEQDLDTENLTRFVIDGGRVLLADDFGSSEGFLDRLSLTRSTVSTGHLPHDTFVDDRPALPLFAPRGRHPLLEGVHEVVANHPAVLFNVGGPVVAYAEGGGLVYDMSLGEGRVVVFGDASMLINQMLPVRDNERLVANTLSYLCEGQRPCRITLLVRGWEEQGSYQGGDDGAESALARSVERLNESLRHLLGGLPTQELFYYLSILLVAGLAAYLATVFPLRTARSYSRYVSDALDAVPGPQTEFDWNLARFGRGKGEVNFILPMAILKEIFEELFLREMGLWPSTSDHRPGVEELGRRFARKYLQKMSPREARRVEKEVLDVLATFAQIPTRHRVFLDSDAFFGEREMLRHYGRARKILNIMGVEEEYERRTSHLA